MILEQVTLWCPSNLIHFKLQKCPLDIDQTVLYSLYWVFFGGVQKKEVKKGKIVVADVWASTC
jgi:hypothetical protein